MLPCFFQMKATSEQLRIATGDSALTDAELIMSLDHSRNVMRQFEGHDSWVMIQIIYACHYLWKLGRLKRVQSVTADGVTYSVAEDTQAPYMELLREIVGWTTESWVV